MREKLKKNSEELKSNNKHNASRYDRRCSGEVQKNEASNYPVQLLLDDFDATLDWLFEQSEKNAKTIQKNISNELCNFDFKRAFMCNLCFFSFGLSLFVTPSQPESWELVDFFHIFFSQLLFLFFMQWQIELRSHNSFDFTIPSSSSDFSSFHSVMTKSSWDCTFHGIHRQHSSTLSALLMSSVAVNEATGGAEGQLPEKSQVLKSHANSFVQLTASYFFLAYFPYKYIYFGLLASVLIWRHLRWLSTFEWRWNIHKISSIYRRSPVKTHKRHRIIKK